MQSAFLQIFTKICAGALSYDFQEGLTVTSLATKMGHFKQGMFVKIGPYGNEFQAKNGESWWRKLETLRAETRYRKAHFSNLAFFGESLGQSDSYF